MSELPPKRSRLPRDLGPRVAVALPAAAVLVVLNHVGGLAFALPLAVLGLLGAWELARLRPAIGGPVFLAGLIWVALCLTHAVLLRELPHGAGLVVDVLLAT